MQVLVLGAAIAVATSVGANDRPPLSGPVGMLVESWPVR